MGDHCQKCNGYTKHLDKIEDLTDVYITYETEAIAHEPWCPEHPLTKVLDRIATALELQHGFKKLDI